MTLLRNAASPVVSWLLERCPDAALTLLDVGASGGIAPLWNQWRPRLRAIGFDPLVSEIDTLNRAEADSRIRYEAAWIGAPDRSGGENPVATVVRDLTSAIRALDCMGLDFRSAFFNRGAAVEYTDRHLTLDQYCRDLDLAEVDFIKIDTDGHDLHVLRGAEETLQARGVLGVLVESMLHGPPGPDASTFANIDNVMREQGFYLFDLHVARYTRAALPGVFTWDQQANTRAGQVRWVDALYFKDPVVSAAVAAEGAPPSERLLKLLALYDMFGLADCAAQLAVWMRGQGIAEALDLTSVLDAMTPANPYGATSHAAYIAAFEADPTRFFPSNYQAAEALAAQTATVELLEALEPLGEGRLEGEGTPTLHIPAHPWGYAAALRIARPPSDLAVVTVDLEVGAGEVFLTLADPDLTDLGDHKRLTPADGRQRVTLVDPVRDTLVLRNGAALAPSSCRVFGVTAHRRAR